jgi:hypothetical protein
MEISTHINEDWRRFPFCVRRSERGQICQFPVISAHRGLKFVEPKRAKKLFAPEPLEDDSSETNPLVSRSPFRTSLRGSLLRPPRNSRLVIGSRPRQQLVDKIAAQAAWLASAYPRAVTYTSGFGKMSDDGKHYVLSSDTQNCPEVLASTVSMTSFLLKEAFGYLRRVNPSLQRDHIIAARGGPGCGTPSPSASPDLRR